MVAFWNLIISLFSKIKTEYSSVLNYVLFCTACAQNWDMEDEENIEDELFLVESQLQDIQGLITLSTSQLTCRINFMHKVATPTWLLLHPRPRKRHALLHRSSVQIRRWYDCYCDASIWVLLMQPAPLLTKPSLTCNLMCRPSPSSIMQETFYGHCPHGQSMVILTNHELEPQAKHDTLAQQVTFNVV
jgi:hypothetical protein